MFISIDAFYDYLVNKGTNLKFSKDEFGASFVAVGLEGSLSFSNDTSKDGLVRAHLQAAHVGKNRNRSQITYNSMKKNLKSIKNRPILAYIHQLEIDGEEKNVFGWHAMHEGDNGEVIYDEIPVGHVPADAKPELVYDADNDKEYIETDAYLYEGYTKAPDILMDAEGKCPVSVEIDVYDFSYDAKEKILNIDDFVFKGITILGYYEDGSVVEPAMEGANISLLNFNVDKATFEIDQNSMKGGKDEMGLFEQLLKQYNVTAEDVTFEHENLTDEELKAKFEEMFGSAEADPAPESNFEDEADSDSAEGGEAEADNESEPEAEEGEIEPEAEEPEAESQEDAPAVQDDEPVKKVENSITYSVNGKEFAVSLNDKIYALGTLVNDTYSESDNAYYSVLVYDKELVMVDVWAGSAYRQAYSERAGVFSLKGDRVPVHAIYVTDTEEAEIENIRSKYSAMSEELAKYQKAAEDSRKEAIINSDEWELISDSAEFAQIREKVTEFSADEIQAKCDALLLSYIKNNSKKEHVSKDTNQHKFSFFRVPEGKSAETSKRYGNIFD